MLNNTLLFFVVFFLFSCIDDPVPSPDPTVGPTYIKFEVDGQVYQINGQAVHADSVGCSIRKAAPGTGFQYKLSGSDKNNLYCTVYFSKSNSIPDQGTYYYPGEDIKVDFSPTQLQSYKKANPLSLSISSKVNEYCNGIFSGTLLYTGYPSKTLTGEFKNVKILN